MKRLQIEQYSSLLSTTNAKRREDWTLDDWVVGLHSIYGERNSSKSRNEHWLQVSNDASQLSEEVRKGNLEIVVQEAVKIFGRPAVLPASISISKNSRPTTRSARCCETAVPMTL